MPRRLPDSRNTRTIHVALCLIAALALATGACSKRPKEKRIEREVVVQAAPSVHNAEADRLVAKEKSAADDSERRALFEKALAIEPGHLGASTGLAKILAADPASDPARIVELLARVSGANPSDREAHLGLARARMRLASPDVHGARLAYEQAITLNPGEPEAYRELARTYMIGDAAKPAEAVGILRTAIRIAPKRADIAEELGRALEAAGEREAAEAAFRYAKEKTGGDVGNVSATNSRED